MKWLTLDIICHHDSKNIGGTYRLTLCGIDHDEVTLELHENQVKLVNSRLERSFYVRCRKEKILQEIEDAGSGKALEDIARRYYLCDDCNFDGINLYGVKRILRVVVESLYRYPKLRSKLCFIGTHEEYEKLLVRMEKGDKEVLNAINLQYICTEENAKKLGHVIHEILRNMENDHESYVATAICAFGLFDAILLDKNDYDGYAYLDFIKRLRSDAADGFHPKGCHTPESVVYHELGHLLDDMLDLSQNKKLKKYYEGLTERDIKYGLSEYACTSPKEFIAEAFAEYSCNPRPRPIAEKVGELLNSAYKVSS